MISARAAAAHQPAPAKARTPHHQPELDGIRGLAILAVLLSHAAGILGVLPHRMPHPAWTPIAAFVLVPGWGGVDLFFTLSGFLITGILLRARKRPTYFRPFYARRVLRIFPIYYLFLTVTLIAGHIWLRFGEQLPAGTAARVSYFLYLQNWPVFWPNWVGLTSIWGSFWSLAVEEQFYLVWPTIVRLLSVRTMLGICAFGFALGIPLRYFLIQHFTGISGGIIHFPLSRLDGLFVGAACALYREQRGRPVPLRWAAVSFTAGAAMFGFIAVFHVREMVGLGMHICTFGITAYALMAGGLVAASQHPVARLQKILTLRPLLLAGRYSYGMYVYHLVIYLGFEALARRISPATNGEFTFFPALGYMAIAVLATTAFAAFSFHFFEKKFLEMKRFFPSPAAPVAAS